jgi:site-specific DNA recombinase
MIPAVAYYRMSTDDQTTSVPAQRAAVQRMAKDKGYRILRDYIDEGISGDATEKRKAFQRMIADAEARGDFRAVLCWDQDRFGRFDSIEAGRWIYPLRQAGIKLVTVTQGVIDWSDFAGRVLYSIQQEGKHQFLRDLSRNTLRGMAEKAKAGQWVCGRPPLGYVIGPDGRLQLGNPQAVATVREIFARYLSGMSLRGLVEHLNASGRRTATGRPWEYVGVRFVLKNANYTGDFHWNLRSDSKYSTLRKGQVDGTPTERRETDQADWVIVPGTHPPIVDHATYLAAQERLKSNRHRSTPKPNGGGFVLSGLLRCAACGSAMVGNTYSGLSYYLCGGYFHRGANFCGRNSVRQEELVDQVTTTIEGRWSDRKFVADLRKSIERQAKDLLGPAASDDRRQQLAAIQRELETASRNMALAGSDALRIRYEAIVAELAEREESLKAALGIGERPLVSLLRQANEAIDVAVKKLARLGEALSQASPAERREFFHATIERVHVSVRSEPRAKRRRFYLDSGEIHLRELNLLGNGPRFSPCTVRFAESNSGNRAADRCETRRDRGSAPRRA